MFELKYNIANYMEEKWCGIEFVRTFNKKSVPWTVYVCTFPKVVFLGGNKPMKYDVVRTLILASTLQKVFMF